VVVRTLDDGAFEVHGLSAREIGEAALRAGVALHELTPQQATLEDAFMALTDGAVDFRAAVAA